MGYSVVVMSGTSMKVFLRLQDVLDQSFALYFACSLFKFSGPIIYSLQIC